MLLTGFTLAVPLMRLDKARIGELNVGQETLVPIQFGLLQRKNHDRSDQAENEHEGHANHDVRRAQAIEAVEGRVQCVDTHGEEPQSVYQEGVCVEEGADRDKEGWKYRRKEGRRKRYKRKEQKRTDCPAKIINLRLASI